MVYKRLNERENNPNEHINFITALPEGAETESSSARELLRALAAQVKPIMKMHGFEINHFEEYQWNTVFAGRNWNAGSKVEIVLRRRNGSFAPMGWLLGTLCHELAHNLHMNHGPQFQALWDQLRKEVEFLQCQGYYGDGFWSSGKRLADSAEMDRQRIGREELPEFMCGGAQSREAPVRRRRRGFTGPSEKTGAQTAKRRKAGGRITSKDAFSGSGRALNDDVLDEERKKIGTGFRKSANSKKAREERLNAIERRLAALQGAGAASANAGKRKAKEDDDDDEKSDDEVEIVPETDKERKEIMSESIPASEMDDLRLSDVDFDRMANFVLPMKSHDVAGSNTLDSSAKLMSLVASSILSESREAVESPLREDGVEIASSHNPGSSLGPSSMPFASDIPSRMENPEEGPSSSEWECHVCTLKNDPGYLACSACSTPKGQTVYQYK